MKRVLRKLLSTVLALVMVLSLMPMSALADGPSIYRPTAPTASAAAAALSGAKVWVNCTTNGTHDRASYSITADSLVVGDPFYRDGWYYCRVTVNPNSYVRQYAEANGTHTSSNTDSKTLTLWYNWWDGKWSAFENSSVTFYVTCKNSGGGSGGTTSYPVYVYARIYDTAGRAINPGSSTTLHGAGAVQAVLNSSGWITIGMVENATEKNPTEYSEYHRNADDTLNKDLKQHELTLYNAIVATASTPSFVPFEDTIGLTVAGVDQNSWEVVTASGASSYNVSGTTWHMDGKITAYTVTYNANGGTSHTGNTNTIVDGYYLNGATALVQGNRFTAPQKMEFAGWNTAANGSGTAYAPAGSVTNITGDITLYAQWKPAKPTNDEVKTIFDDDVEVECTNKDVDHDEKEYALMDDTFSIGDVVYNSSTGKYTCTVTLTQTSDYITQYSTDTGVTHTEDTSASGAVKSVTLTWNSTQQKWEESGEEDDFVIKVKCDTPKYTVTYNWGTTNIPTGVILPTNSNTYKANEKYPVDSTYYEGYTTVQDGYTYTFSGWKLNDTVVTGQQTMGNGNVTLTGAWTKTAKSYTITYDLQGGALEPSKTNPTTYTVETESFTLNNPTKNGYTFTGWTGTGLSAATTEVTVAKGSTGDRAYTANWTATVTSVTKELVTADPSVTGITYSNYDNSKIESNKLTADKGDTVTLLYKITVSGGAGASFTVTEDSDKTVLVGSGATQNGRVYTGTVGTTGSTVFYVAKTFTISGAANEKLDNAVSVSTPGVTPTNPSDVEVETKKYTVTYDWGTTNIPTGETLPTNSNTYKTGDLYSVDSVYTATTKINQGGYTYTFSGWKLNDTVVTGQQTMGNGNVTLTGAWTKTAKSYTITYDLQGGALEPSKTNPTTYTVETESFTLNNPTKNGYTFTGWTGTGLSAATTEVTVAKGSTGNRAYTANWAADTVEVDLTDLGLVNKNYTSTYGVSDTDTFYFVARIVPAAPAARQTGNAAGYTVNGSVKLSTGETKLVNFNKITLPVGSYDVTVTETAGTRTNVTYDASSYSFQLYVHGVGDVQVEKADNGTFTNKFNGIRYIPYVPAPDPTVKVRGLDTVNHVAYIVGRNNGLVDPNGVITRAEVATIYFRLMTDEFRNEYWSDHCSYTDVADTAWYNVAIATLEKAGIIQDSVTGGTFRPNEPITRAELAVMAAQFCTVSGNIPKTSFTDISRAYWAADEIALVEYAGWIEGYNGKFRPDDNLTRAECVTIVNRMLNRGAEHEDMLDGMVTFPDNPATNKQWYYEAIQEAANSHHYTRTGKRLTGEHFNGEKWTELLPAPRWAAMEQAWANANRK